MLSLLVLMLVHHLRADVHDTILAEFKECIDSCKDGDDGEG